MRTALRTAIATALVAGVAIAPALTAGTAFAADGPAAVNPVASSATAAPSATSAPVAPSVPAASAPAEQAATPAEPQAGTPAAAPAESATAQAGTATAPVRTVRLAGGLSAKVYAKGDQHPYYTATVVKDGRTLGELKAGAGYGGKDTEVFAGYAVTLTSEGQVTAKATAGETPQGTLVRTRTLVDGTVAKIYKVADGHHRAELFQQGKRVGTLDADHWSVAANNNGAFLVLNADGTTYNWVGNYLPGAKPGQYKLANGVRLELVKRDGRYGIQEIRLGVGTGVSYLKGDRQVYGFTGGGLVVLERDGGLAAYIPGAAKQSAPTPYTRDDACTIYTEVGIGAGTKAALTMSPNGPTATLRDIGSDKQVYTTLDRNHPSLPKSAGIIARIDNPFSATPTLYTKVEGGTAKGATHAFPKMQKGCTLNPVKGTSTPVTGTTGTNGHNGSNGSNGLTVNTGGQTSVVPRGGVAAGAELGTEGDSTALFATGAGAASLAAAGLGFVVLRRRNAASRA
ncbi:hypothetical protein ASC82_28690 [Streptomyces sp. Root431]|uniref:hypothetical protein n=1 Tax=Streptomyces sp. Root431 TaxID=1736535 RepID=UPI0006F57BB4|nr:hypothetical protein [Streptomyces sp. Root431]KQX16601.1 hypothetical protein ASC82_28690 [Streptomyces sp. Root431]